jgi:hypothetical protein
MSMLSTPDDAAGPAATAAAGGEPHCLYLYYVTAADDHGEPVIQAFVRAFERPIADIQRAIAELTQEVADGLAAPVGWGLGDLRWHRKSYLAVVLNDPARRFMDEDGLDIVDGRYSFDPGRLIEFDIDEAPGGTTSIQAIYRKNHVRKKDGTPWGGVADEYEIYLRPDPPYPHHLHEDTGQNLGPPVPPP